MGRVTGVLGMSAPDITQCLPPSIGYAIGLTVTIGAFAAVVVAVVTAVVVSDVCNAKPKQAAIASAVAVLTVVALTCLCGALIHHGASIDYDRCEQRTRITVTP
jgi:hypothetical protein